MASGARALRARVRRLRTRDELASLLPAGHPLAWYVPGRRVTVSDKMQTRYSYVLTEPVGQNFDPQFSPALTPAQMLRRGVFEGKYLNDCVLELPREWYERALSRLCPGDADVSVNEFKVKSRMSLQQWREKGWIPIAPGDHDVRGWFQWYCRYYLGRRDPAVDSIQIARWRSFARHAGQIQAAYATVRRKPKTRAEKKKHRPRQRQALLQWAYDPYV